MEGGPGGFAPDAPAQPAAPRGAFDRVGEAVSHAVGDRPLGRLDIAGAEIPLGKDPGLVGGAARGADAVLRGLSALVAGGSGVIAGLAQKAGMSEADANKLHRDLKHLVDAASGVVPTARIPSPARQVRVRPEGRVVEGEAVPPTPAVPESLPPLTAHTRPVQTHMLERGEGSSRLIQLKDPEGRVALEATLNKYGDHYQLNHIVNESKWKSEVGAMPRYTNLGERAYVEAADLAASEGKKLYVNASGETSDYARRIHERLIAQGKAAPPDEHGVIEVFPLRSAAAPEPPPGFVADAAPVSGKPIEVTGYHGTRHGFDDLDPARLGNNPEKEGFYFSSKPEMANLFAQGENANIRPAKIRMENPLVHDMRGQTFTEGGLEQMQTVRRAKAEGYDGVVFQNYRDGNAATPDTVYTPFKTENVQPLYGRPQSLGAAAPGAPPSGGITLTNKKEIDKNTHFYEMREDGKYLGTVSINAKNPKEIEIINISNLKGPGALGAAKVRSLLEQAKKLYPDAVSIFGQRVSGARGGASYARQQTRVPLATQTEPPPQSLGAAAPGARPSGAAPLPPTIAEAEAAVHARIGEPPKAPMYNHTDAYTDFVDNLHPIRKVVESTGQPIDTILNPYEQFRLARGVGGKAEHFLRHGTFDYDTFRTSGPSFAEIMKPIEKEKEAFKSYLMSKRALELEPRGIETGIPLDAARVVVQNGQRFENAAQALQTYQSKLLDYVQKSGLLSDDAVAAMREASNDYIPFYRIMDEPSRAGAGGGFSTRTPTSRMKGSERLINDPLESVIRNTHTFITLAERNRALQTLVKFSDAHPDAIPMRKVNSARPITVHGDEVGRMLDDMGVPTQMYGSPDSFDIFRKMDKQLAGDEIAVWNNGKREVYKTDPQIAEIIKGMDQQSLELWQRMAAVPARWLRAGVVLSPEYMVRNFTRDQMNAAFQSKHGYRPVYDFMRGLWQTGTSGKAYQDWLKGGGSQSALVAIDRDYAGKDIWKYGPNPTAWEKTKYVIKTPIELLRIMSETIDNATRVGEFMRATKGADDPASIMRGGMAARDVTQDFQRIGAQMRALNQMIAFSSAQIQGIDRELSNLRHRPIPTLIKVAGMITVPSVLLWAANHGDPRYEDAPNWEKDQFWFVLPSDKNQPAYKIPKPFTLGMTFGSLPERMLSDYFDDKPEAYNDFLKNLSGTMWPNMIPTAAVPMLEQWGNRSFFMQRPLVPSRIERGVKSEQFTEQTPEVARMAGRGISKIPGMSDSNLSSPIVLENYVRQWTGTMGRYGMAGADSLLRAAGQSDKPVPPASTIADTPVIRAFISRYPSAGAQPIQDFYKSHTELERIVSTAREAARSGDSNRADNFRKQVLDRTTGTARRLAVLNREIRQVYSDREMTPEVKRETIRKSYLEMIDLAKQANIQIRNMKKNLASRGYQGPD